MPRNPWDIKIKPVKMPKLGLFDYTKTGKKVRAPVNVSLQKEIFIRSKGKCESCKKTLKGIKPQIHHKDKNPKNNKKNNLTLLCPNCHSKKHLKDKPKKTTKKKKNPWEIKQPKLPKMRFF
jgi:5-methylcytosine-specific restriction endonuclease McrA